VLRIRIRDPGSVAFLAPASGIRDPRWVKSKGSGSRIRDEQPGSYFLALRNHFFGLKYLNSLVRIRDPGWKQFGSGIRDEKKSDPSFGSRDKHPGSATLIYILQSKESGVDEDIWDALNRDIMYRILFYTIFGFSEAQYIRGCLVQGLCMTKKMSKGRS
jgi:hypothetical protein